MARKLRVQYPGAIYHVLNRGDRRAPIFRDDEDRQRWLTTRAALHHQRSVAGCAKSEAGDAAAGGNPDDVGLDSGALADGVSAPGGQLPERVTMRQFSTMAGTGTFSFLIRCIALSLLALLSTSCVSPRHDERAKVESDIREAVFRYQFQHDGSALLNNAVAYYIAIKGRDPTDEFIQRFAGHIPPMKKASLCIIDAREGVRDVKTDQRGLRFDVGSVKWIGDTQAEVSGGFYKHGLSASGNTYDLTQQNGIWCVTRIKLLWMS
ncbi:MAG: hypothetical protein KIS67_23415 [Verrucomicrobiae bacterium]|nr:hypothetical protein [Verrucomicrobiae bacterium]